MFLIFIKNLFLKKFFPYGVFDTWDQPFRRRVSHVSSSRLSRNVRVTSVYSVASHRPPWIKECRPLPSMSICSVLSILLGTPWPESMWVQIGLPIYVFINVSTHLRIQRIAIGDLPGSSFRLALFWKHFLRFITDIYVGVVFPLESRVGGSGTEVGISHSRWITKRRVLLLYLSPGFSQWKVTSLDRLCWGRSASSSCSGCSVHPWGRRRRILPVQLRKSDIPFIVSLGFTPR